MAPDLNTFIHNLPKCELHVHLEGCLTPNLAKTLAARNNIPLPSSIAQADHTSGYAFHDLTSFLAVYYPAMAVLQTRQDFHDLAWDYLCKAKAQNVRRAEMFFDPQAHTSRGIAFETVLDGYWNAVQRAKPELNVSAGLILCILRDHDVASAEAALKDGLRDGNRQRIVGLGLDSDERDNPPVKFKDVFEKARKEGQGWKLTMHCDIDQKNTLEHIRQALIDIKVDRIDHGTNIVDDAQMVEFVRAKGIGLTCCPISNSVVTPDFKGKEILGLLRQGVKVTVNSDDPAYFRGYIAENLVHIGKNTDIGLEELVKLERNAFEIAWTGEDERKVWLAELDEYEKKTLSLQ